MKISYVDFWLETRNAPLSPAEIHGDGWSAIGTSRELRVIHEGVGLFHVTSLEKIIGEKIHITDPRDADVIVCSGFGNVRYFFPHKIKIFLCYEATFPIDLPNSVCFSSSLEHFYLPIYLCYHDFDLYVFLLQGGRSLDELAFQQKKDCLSIISNPNGEFRNRFLEQLMEHFSVDNYGKYANNTRDEVIDSSCWYDPRISTVIQRYKFMICMENCSMRGYHTEKIMHGFRNNVIPIYYGDPECQNIFNPKAYINVNELGVEKSIEKIRFLSQNLKEYNEMLSEPKIHSGSILMSDSYHKFMSRAYFEQTIRTIFEHAGKDFFLHQ
ncbi:hypothetical protein EBZ80_03560 [bacterium]|nr:hypothetical protein [bacterium]